MKFISWNVNGFRACLKKGFEEFFYNENADFFCLQETKMQEGQAEFDPEEYYQYYNSAEKKGYSGVAIFAKQKPLKVLKGINGNHDDEGRLLTLEYKDFYLVCCYTPNSKEKLARLDYRMKFEDDFRSYLIELKMEKPVIICGDLNVAHTEIDLKNPKNNRKNAGFSDEERSKMTELLKSGFIDTFRYLYPDLTGFYTWWSYRFNARNNNAGWRIDYFIVSEDIKENINAALIYSNIEGSDHCPVGLDAF
ncbi:MAG TPA: exodeoxyribonuclease III [Anaerovoracaceae bacterium]|nr:exodeoxyribonuclease III [Anaerovoracaceae bacterium]